MVLGKQPSDYRVENIEKRDKCTTCNGTGWVDKKPVELSSEYPKRIKHTLGHDVIAYNADEEAAHLAHPAKVEDDAHEPLAVPDAQFASSADGLVEDLKSRIEYLTRSNDRLAVELNAAKNPVLAVPTPLEAPYPVPAEPETPVVPQPAVTEGEAQ